MRFFWGGMKMFVIKENQNMQIPPCRSEVGEFFRAYDSELKGSRVFVIVGNVGWGWNCMVLKAIQTTFCKKIYCI